MAFSRQHYVKFADILKKMTDRKSQMYLAVELLKLFKADNPRFDMWQFLDAAGIEYSPALQSAMKEGVSPTGGKKPFKVNESFDTLGVKLVSLLPAGQIETLTHNGRVNELAFHGGNPTPEDVQVLADDFEDELDKVQEQFDETHHGFVEAAREADFNEVATGIEKQWNLFAKSLATYRANIENLYKAQQKKLGGQEGGKGEDGNAIATAKTRSGNKYTIERAPKRPGKFVAKIGGMVATSEDGPWYFDSVKDATDTVTKKWR